MEVTQQEIAENVASIKAIPELFISRYLRQYLITRAERGDDVYAYQSIVGTWNIWEVNRRTQLVPGIVAK